MARTGWKNTATRIKREIRDILANKLTLKPKAENGSTPYPSYLKTFDLLRDTMQTVAASRDISLYVSVEQMLVEHDLTYYALFKQAEDSLKSGFEQLGDLDTLLGNIREFSGVFHRAYLAGTEPRDVKDGLPLDGIRKLIRSHKRRIHNMLTDASTRSPNEVAYLECRLSNLNRMEQLYMDEQRAGLGR